MESTPYCISVSYTHLDVYKRQERFDIFMSRREFLEVLRGQLSGQMTQGRAAAHVRYYEDYIQSQVRNGRSESDVLAELGDPRLIAKTLIDTDDSAAVYDESGYSEESYGADDYADNGTESSACLLYTSRCV